MSNKISKFFDKYNIIIFVAAIVDFFLLKANILSFILFLGYFLNLVLLLIIFCFYYFYNFSKSQEKKKNIIIKLIKTIISFFFIYLVSSLGNMWDNEIKEKAVIYYNQSTITSGYEVTEITALKNSRFAEIFFENNIKIVHTVLFNFKHVTYDSENKWKNP